MQLILMLMNTNLSTIYHFYIYVDDINNNIYKKMNKNSAGQLFKFYFEFFMHNAQTLCYLIIYNKVIA